MGSSYFYLEFLLAWINLLKQAGYQNPAILSVEYSLVPEAVFPKQLNEAMSAYQYLLTAMPDSNKICIAGDSAGGTLALSLLLTIGSHPILGARKPAYATLISPWVTLLSDRSRNTASDYLDAARLAQYAHLYLRSNTLDDVASPGQCMNAEKWRRASPSKGWFFIFGSEEVLSPEIWDLIQRLQKHCDVVDVVEEQGSIHAWPIVSLYLGQTKLKRLTGLAQIVGQMTERMGKGAHQR
jgi:acetyl esterase/lipase